MEQGKKLIKNKYKLRLRIEQSKTRNIKNNLVFKEHTKGNKRECGLKIINVVNKSKGRKCANEREKKEEKRNLTACFRL